MRLLLAWLFVLLRAKLKSERKRRRRSCSGKKVDSNAKGCSALSEHRKKAVKARVEVHALVTIKELPDKKKC